MSAPKSVTPPPSLLTYTDHHAQCVFPRSRSMTVYAQQEERKVPTPAASASSSSSPSLTAGRVTPAATEQQIKSQYIEKYLIEIFDTIALLIEEGNEACSSAADEEITWLPPQPEDDDEGIRIREKSFLQMHCKQDLSKAVEALPQVQKSCFDTLTKNTQFLALYISSSEKQKKLLRTIDCLSHIEPQASRQYNITQSKIVQTQILAKVEDLFRKSSRLKDLLEQMFQG